MEPMYDLARLEDDPGRSDTVRYGVLQNVWWPGFSAHKNVFFSFIYAGTVPGAPAQVATDAAAQLAQFPAPPRTHRAVDLRAEPRYQPHDGTCPDQCSHSTAVDVGERPTDDFLWQRAPWRIYDAGDPQRTEPGVDFLVAYWMGRRHGFVADDTPGRCAAWRTP
jgi:hypothetical protein